MEFVFLILFFVIAITALVAMWKTFEKAGQPGWAVLVPFYNYYIMVKMAEKPDWWMIMFLLPIVNIVFMIMTYNQIAKRFGKDELMTLAIVFMVGWFILGFGDATYKAEQSEQGDQLLDNF